MDKPPSTRERIIEAAVQLFYEQGYEATGMAEILKRAGANSGSFYYFFKGKEDLLLAVLEWYEKHLQPAVIDPACTHTKDPIERIFALLARYRGRLRATGCTYGCPIGRLALEIAPERLEVHEKLARNFAGWSDAVRTFLEQAGDRLPKDLNRADLAQFVLTVMEGGVMQARSFRSLTPFDASVRQLREHFRYLQSNASPKSQSRNRRRAHPSKARKP
jgi:TetR/AcrR family transcriptional regulator, transcriptional repressor for nem operon